MNIGAGDAYRNYLYQQALARSLAKNKAKKLKPKRPKTEKRKRTEKMNRELAARKRELWDLADDHCPICVLCSTAIRRFDDADPDHDNGRGSGGGHRNDEEIHLVHKRGNIAKGSIRLAKWLEKPLEERRRACGGGE